MKKYKTITNTCLVIPCYNEEFKLPINKYYSFLQNETKVVLVFVNDGSTDNTITVLNKIKKSFPNKTEIISNRKNQGKAISVRKGMKYCFEKIQCDFIGYLDADLSASLQECAGLNRFLTNGKKFAFGSRILKIGSVIDRKYSRFLIGRVIATFISRLLKLNVYDTQCGCKLFTINQAKILFENPFISKWLFDVELFFRMIQQHGRDNINRIVVEVPLERWVDVGQSKVKPGYFFKLWVDLLLIKKEYNKMKKTKGASSSIDLARQNG